MRSAIRRSLSWSLSLLAGTGSSASAQLADAAPARPDFSAVDTYAGRLLREYRVPAAAIVIVHDGRIVHLRGFGTDNQGRPVTSATGFVLGSMSKSITALAVMQLVERKQLALDGAVRRYLPWFRVASADSGASITVRQLLLHTSGIPQRAGRAADPASSLADQVAALRTVAPLHAPGTAHAYASANYLVLGAIVEAVSGRSFAEYVQAEIFQPLEMHHSFTDQARARAARFAGGNVYVWGLPRHSSLREDAGRLPTAALVSSAEDLGHFLGMQLQQGRYGDRSLLGAPFVSQMHAGAAPSEGFAYAFGWRDGQLAGVRAVHHGGIVPDFRGKMVMLPESGWSVAVLTNVSSAVPWPIAPVSHRLADDIAAHLEGRPFPDVASTHRVFFAVVAAAMLLLVAAQLRTLRRAWSAGSSRPSAPRRAWRSNVVDVAFVGMVAVLPRYIGVRWTDLLRGAPDVGWWMLVLAALSLATVLARLTRRTA
jgi:CubicO group peptidase (beta-lactamase class C family)